ncbi:PhzF family phenazine biosynthesis protein [Chitinilyticum piscinae]|uniref:PhzF family phenazine biosynthesis protein n=1 Tax=Chitinilyticum piscinae TaxID=2866724 RepID=A0A8J7KGK3_9NEIS|nr:PhzF family phenazine biosynthesis protein [Chitinilyticum piscinae]MBE9610464.1 PhzF family phenazine biosynthesis protein [Chitinilyticum piscinae]
MTAYRYQLLNVFAETRFGGNPLAVFPDARGLDDVQMQAIARQLNLSETTFVFPSATASARVRIFTPGYEMPFAGHPTLGTAWLVNRLQGTDGEVTLELPAGLIPVTVSEDRATLTAQPPRYRAGPDRAACAAMLGIQAEELAGEPLFVDCGVEQLIIELTSREAVSRCKPERTAFEALASNRDGISGTYVWARDAEIWPARYFWSQHEQLSEDYGTGSACANLGGYLLRQQPALPIEHVITQGYLTGREAILRLQVDTSCSIKVSGRIIDIGGGELLLG